MANAKFKGGKCLAIDLDPEGLIAVSGSVGAGPSRVEHAVAWMPGKEHGPPPLTAENAKQLGADLRKRLDAAGVPSAPVVVGIGREKVILKEVKYPGTVPEEETRLVHGQAQRELGDLRNDAVLDYAPLPGGVAEGSIERRALVVVVKKDVYQIIQSFVEGGNWKLAGVTPRPFALAAGLSEALASAKAPALPAPDAAAAIVSLGGQGGEFTVIRHGSVTFTRAVPPQALDTEHTLLSEIRRNLATYESQNPSNPVSAVYVPEAEHRLGGWVNKLDALPIPVHSYDPVATAAESIQSNLRGRFAGAAGLLAGQTVGLPINFASPRQAKAKTDPRKPIFIAAAIAAAVLILGGGIVGWFAVDSADQNLMAKQKQKADLEKLLTDTEPDGKRIAAAEQWHGRSVNYLDELFDQADRMPPGDTVRVSKFTGTATRVDKAGKQNGQATLVLSVGAKNPMAAGELVTAIERDNTKDRKFYTQTTKIVGAADTHANTHNQLSTITTTLNHRAPGEYTRYPTFAPPRRGVLPTAAPETEKKTEPEKKPDEPSEDDF